MFWGVVCRVFFQGSFSSVLPQRRALLNSLGKLWNFIHCMQPQETNPAPNTITLRFVLHSRSHQAICFARRKKKKLLIYHNPEYFPWEKNLSKMPEIFEKDLNCAEKHYIDCELSLSLDFSACHFYLNTSINKDLNVPFYYCPLFFYKDCK